MDQSRKLAVRAAFRSIVIGGVCMGCWLSGEQASIGTAATAAEAPQSSQPDFKIVIDTLKGFFGTLPDYQTGDLITQSQIADALHKLQDAGWRVSESERIVKLGLADDSFLAKELSTGAGRTFMRKIARHPGAYSQIDRLSSISRGQNIVRDLIRQRGGDEFVEYLTTTKGGRNLGGMLAGARHGADLNKPTGRIYTANDLVAELHREFKKQIQK
jgi:hypothetical protein